MTPILTHDRIEILVGYYAGRKGIVQSVSDGTYQIILSDDTIVFYYEEDWKEGVFRKL